MANQRRLRVEKAFLSEPKQTFDRVYAELSTRPIRLAFLIFEDIDQRLFTHIVEYLSLIWGGYHSCLIPTDGNIITDEWWKVLKIYNPDKVVICKSQQAPDLGEDLRVRIDREIQPYSSTIINNFEYDDTIDRLMRGTDFLNSISVAALLNHELDKLKQPLDETRSNIRIPVVREDHPFYLLVAAQIGIPKGIFQEAYTQSFKASRIEFITSDVDEYISHLSHFFNKITPLSITTLGNNPSFKSLFTASLPEGLAIILVGTNWVRDYCLYWNFHLGSNFTRVKSRQILLPYDIFKSSRQVDKLINVLRTAEWCPREIVLFSDSVSKKKQLHLRDRLDRLFSGAKEVSVSLFQSIADFNVSNTATGESTIVEDDRVSFRVPSPTFSGFIEGGDWAVDIKEQSPYEYPLSSQLNYFLCGSPHERLKRIYNGYWVRYGAYQILSARVNKKTSFTTVHQVKPYSAFQALLSDNGYTVQQNDIHSFTEAFSKLLGSTALLENKKVRELFWSMLSRRAFSYNDLKANLQLGNQGDDVIDDLVTKRILLRGIEFTCDHCGLDKWYPINTIDEVMQCSGCLRMVRLPTAPIVKYVLNELAYKAVGNGALSVLLTKRHLERLTIGRKLVAFGLGISKNHFQTDIDLITTHHGVVALCECKEYKNGIPDKERGKVIKQVKGLVDVAKDIEARIVILSTFLPENQQDFLDVSSELRRLNIKNRNNKVAIHLLSLSRLKFINLSDPSRDTDDNNTLFSPII